MTMANKPHLKYQHVYPVVRIDLPVNDDDPSSSVTVVKVFENEAAAKLEVVRLQDLNAKKGCYYLSAISRFIPEAKSMADSDALEN